MSQATIQEQVIRLYKSGAKRIVLNEINARPTIPAQTGVGELGDEAINAGQLTPPFTETSRTTYEKTITVPEGTTELTVEVISTLTMADARGVEVVFNFKKQTT